MRKIFTLLLFITLCIYSISYSSNIVEFKSGNGKEYSVPKGANAVFVTKKDSVIETIVDDINLEKEVIVELNSPPVKVNYGEFGFNESENQNRIMVVEAEQKKFIDDLESIIRNRLNLNDDNLQEADYKITAQYRIVLNGIAVTTKLWVIEEIKKLDYIKKIHDVVEVKGTDDTSNHVIGADSVWSELGITGEGILISIIDTGIDSNHVSLNNGKVVGGDNFVYYNSNDFYDDHGHGTHCAGIAAANGGGLTGVAPDAKLLAVKVLSSNNSGSSSRAISGIEYSLDPDGDPNTDDGADILSMSLGGPGNPEDALSTAVANAVTNGAVVVVAAGNNGELFSVDSPGCARDALTVGASDNDDEMANFSSRGPLETSFDIKPDITAPGVAIYSALPENQFTYMSGTSMAAPHVAGAAALLKELHPNWTPQEIKSSIVCNAVDIDAEIWEQGNGRLDIYKAAQSESILSPGLVNFGFVDLNTDIWTSSDTLTLINKSDSEQTYNITLEYDLPEGFSYSLEPDEVTVSADTDTTIILSITIDNDSFPVKEDAPHVYSGKILAESNTDLVSSSFSFVKSRILNISFDEAPSHIIIIDSDDNVNSYSFIDELKLLVPIDTFDIIAYYTGFDQDRYIHIVESVKINSDTICNINIEKNNIANNLNIKYYDKNNDQINIKDGGWFIFTMRDVWAVSSIGVIRENYYFSDFSDNYKTELISIAYPENEYENNNKYVAFYSTDGMDGSDSLKISPQSSVLINQKFQNKFDSDTIYYDDYISNSMAHAHYSNFHSYLTYPFNYKTYYYNYNDNESRLWLTSHYFSDSDLALSDVDNKIIMGPFVNMSDGNLNFLQQNLTDTLRLFDLDSHNVNTNIYQCFKGKVLIDGNTLKVTSPPTIDYFKRNIQGLFHSDFGYTYHENVSLKLFENDNLLDEFNFNNLRNTDFSNLSNNYYQKTNLTNNNYKLELTYDTTIVYTKFGFTLATIGFKPNSTKDSLPVILSLNASKNGIANDNFMLNDSINICAKVKDIREGDSVKIFYRIFGNEDWFELETSMNNNKFIASINELDSICYYSIKVEIKRDTDNYIIHELEPTFACGISVPELINPEDDTYQDLLGEFVWKTIENAQSYTLQISENAGFNDVIIEKTINDTLYKLQQPLEYNKKYFWRVRANTDIVSSLWSEANRFYSVPEDNNKRYELYVWGNNDNGQLGIGNTESINEPQHIGENYFNRVSAGHNYALSLKNEGTIWSWGNNDEGQLGNSDFDETNSPEKSSNSNYWKEIAAGDELSLAIKNDGTLWAWGDNSEGFLGHFNYDKRNTPEKISNYNNWEKIASGGKQYFAIKEDGTLWAWGRNDWGELGLGEIWSKQSPFMVGEDNNWKDVKTGQLYTIALKHDGTIWGCGYNISGQLGDDEQTIRKTFQQIGNESAWKAISSGGSHILVLKNDGTLWACGNNNQGQLGDGTFTQRSTLTQIGTDDDWIAVASGDQHNLAIKKNGTLWAWGFNHKGQIGDSSNLRKKSPVCISNDTNWVYVDANYNQSFALKAIPFDMEQPVLISPLNLKYVSTLYPEFSWYSIDYTTEYLLQVSEDEDFGNLIISEILSDTTYQAMQALDNYTQYFWRVKAYSDNDESLFSEIRSFTSYIPVPETPVLLSPDDESIDNMPYIDLKWSAGNYADSYDLQVSAESDFSTLEFEINTNNIHKLITDLNLGNEYYWRVRAVNISGTSEWSNEFSFTIASEIDGNILYIPLNQGWNNISSNIEIENMDIESIFSIIEEDVVIVKDKNNIFIPAFSLNLINQWNNANAYKVYSLFDNTLVMHGEQVLPEDILISLDKGWNALPYLRASGMNVSNALDEIYENTIIVTDDEGNICIPGLIDTIGELLPGKAYMIYMKEADSFYYPANE